MKIRAGSVDEPVEEDALFRADGRQWLAIRPYLVWSRWRPGRGRFSETRPRRGIEGPFTAAAAQGKRRREDADERQP